MGENCSRRQFIKKGLTISTMAAANLMCWDFNRLVAADKTNSIPQLVAIKNAEPERLFAEGIKALGGMKRFVKKNQTVVIKPNIGWNRSPETGANTNPDLVKAIVEHVRAAGAKKVYVFDHSVDHGPNCYKKSAIEKMAKSAGAMMVPANHDKYYHTVHIPMASKLLKTSVHELILDCDVYINVPVLKHHFSSGLTLAMKNQMGVVWDRGRYHRIGLHRCITDFCLYKKPDLNILDAYRITLRNGPQRAGKDDVVIKKTQLISTDIVATDAAAAKIFGEKPENIQHILLGHKEKIGEMNLDRLNIKKITL